jgi:hypothetical protein
MQPVAESVRNMVQADIADVMGVLPGGENSKSPSQLNTNCIGVTAEVTEIMVAPGRFELPTSGLGNRCSIQLSYGAVASKYSRFNTLQSFVQVSVSGCKRPFPKTSFA